MAPERPRLLINGVPVQPEELGRGLSEAVLLQLSITKERYVPPEPPPEEPPPPPPLEARSPLRLVVVFVLFGLAVAALLFLR